MESTISQSLHGNSDLSGVDEGLFHACIFPCRDEVFFAGISSLGVPRHKLEISVLQTQPLHQRLRSLRLALTPLA